MRYGTADFETVRLSEGTAIIGDNKDLQDDRYSWGYLADAESKWR